MVCRCRQASGIITLVKPATGAISTPRRQPEQTQPLPFAVALGHRLRQVREAGGDTAADVAERARAVGLSWDRSTVTKIELGERQVTAAELVLATVVYGRAASDLLPTEAVRLSQTTTARPESLRDCLVQPPSLHDFQVEGLIARAGDALEVSRGTLKAASVRMPGASAISILGGAHSTRDEATVKAARRLGTTPEAVATTAHQLWGRSLTQERDARVEQMGPATTRVRQARRGRVTRTLDGELSPAVAHVSAPGEGAT